MIFASKLMLEDVKGIYDDEAAIVLSTSGWCWQAETGLHVLSLYPSDFFERYPELTIIICHTGELLHFPIEWDILASRMRAREGGLCEVWRSNIRITTSGGNVCVGTTFLFVANDYNRPRYL